MASPESGRPRGSSAFLFAVLASGAGLVLLGLGLAPATTEALPFGIGLLVVGVAVGLPSYRKLKAALSPEMAPLPGELAAPGDSRPPASVACPNCGGPAPIQLAEPGHSTCAHCQHRFALAAELSAVLRAAAQHVAQQSIAERHISKAIQTLALREQGWQRQLRQIGRGLIGLALLVSAYGWLGRNGNEHWQGYFAFGLTATGWVLAVTRLASKRVPSGIRQIVGAWTALQLPGSPGLMCRVCGGPLPEHAAAVLRCGYCSADNLAGPEVLAQLAASASHAQRGWLAFDQRRRQGDALAAFALLFVPALILIGWFAAGAFAGSGFTHAGELQIWSDGGARFVVVRTARFGRVQPCVAITVPDGSRTRVVFDFEHLPSVSPEALAAALVLPPVAPAWLVDKQIEGKGKVSSVYRLLRYPSRHLLRLGQHGSTHYLPSDFGVLGGQLTCLTDFDPGQGESIDLAGK